jgi:hypothetical protein
MEYSNDIKGWIAPDELQFLYDTAKDMKYIVEIGSYKGKSTVAMLESGNQVIAIDHWEGSEGLKMTGNEYDEFIRNTKGYDNLVIIKGDSVESAKYVDKADMVFIDGDHTYEGVKRDIEAWSPKTKMICGHDHDLPEVKKAVEEAFKIDKLVGSIWIKYL